MLKMLERRICDYTFVLIASGPSAALWHYSVSQDVAAGAYFVAGFAAVAVVVWGDPDTTMEGVTLLTWTTWTQSLPSRLLSTSCLRRVQAQVMVVVIVVVTWGTLEVL